MKPIERFEFDRPCALAVPISEGIAICVQANGERLQLERWAFEACARGECKDPALVRIYNGAVKYQIGW